MRSTETGAAVHPVDALIGEHEVILAVLEALEKDANALRTKGTWSRDAWLRYPDFLRNFADRCHHGKEEDVLFPRLVALGIPDQGGPIGVMKQQHGEGRELVTRLANAIDTGATAGAVTAALAFVGLLRDHIAKENGVLFPIGKQVLGAADVELVAQGFARAEREIMGEGTHCRYLELAVRICADAGVEFGKARGARLTTGCCGHH